MFPLFVVLAQPVKRLSRKDSDRISAMIFRNLLISFLFFLSLVQNILKSRWLAQTGRYSMYGVQLFTVFPLGDLDSVTPTWI